MKDFAEIVLEMLPWILGIMVLIFICAYVLGYSL